MAPFEAGNRCQHLLSPTTLRIVDGLGVRRVGEEEMTRQTNKHGLSAPNWSYACYDNAVRAADGRSIVDHQLHLSGPTRGG